MAKRDAAPLPRLSLRSRTPGEVDARHAQHDAHRVRAGGAAPPVAKCRSIIRTGQGGTTCSRTITSIAGKIMSRNSNAIANARVGDVTLHHRRRSAAGPHPICSTPGAPQIDLSQLAASGFAVSAGEEGQ